MNFLSTVNFKTFGIVLLIVAVLSLVFGILIIVVSKACKVDEDEKTKKISELLANANCGGCGYAGCGEFAKALASEKASINDCGATPLESKKQIAEILGVPFDNDNEKIAIVHCGGGYLAANKYEYVGLKTCFSEKNAINGRKKCLDCCLGNGDCLKKCNFSAIKIKNGVANIDYKLCIGCGACVKNCPKNIIELIPKSAKLFVACSSQCKGKEVMDSCIKGCIGCGLCAKNCPQNAITMENNIPVIDYTKCNACKTCVNKCPRKCIKEI